MNQKIELKKFLWNAALKDKTTGNRKDKFREIVNNLRSHIGLNGVTEREVRRDGYKATSVEIISETFSVVMILILIRNPKNSKHIEKNISKPLGDFSRAHTMERP